MEKADGKNKTTGWTFYQWTNLGWIETGIKAIALFIGLWTFWQSRTSHIWMIPSGIRLIQWIVLWILSLGIFLAIFNRWHNKEITSMIFILFNNLGHWGMFLALLRNTGWSILPIFAFLMMSGDSVKVLFLRKQHYTEKNISTQIFIIFTLIFVIGYGLIGLLSYID